MLKSPDIVSRDRGRTWNRDPRNARHAPYHGYIIYTPYKDLILLLLFLSKGLRFEPWVDEEVNWTYFYLCKRLKKEVITVGWAGRNDRKFRP